MLSLVRLDCFVKVKLRLKESTPVKGAWGAEPPAWVKASFDYSQAKPQVPLPLSIVGDFNT